MAMLKFTGVKEFIALQKDSDQISKSWHMVLPKAHFWILLSIICFDAFEKCLAFHFSLCANELNI